MATAYQQAQRAGQTAVRTAILDCASRLLMTEGIAALTMRRVAAEAGCSTKVIYTLFGGKEGLVDELYREGFVRLRRAQERVARDLAPLDRARALSAVYREHARAQPNYYCVMFEQVLPGYQPSQEARAAAAAAFAVAVDAVAACMDAGVFAPGDPYEVAKIFWAASHGAVSLELAGHFPPDRAAQRYETLLTAVARAFLATPPPA